MFPGWCRGKDAGGGGGGGGVLLEESELVKSDLASLNIALPKIMCPAPPCWCKGDNLAADVRPKIINVPSAPLLA